MNKTAEPKSGLTFSKPLLWCSCIAFALCLLTHPQVFTQEASNALVCCLTVLVPALLPFIIAGRLLYAAGFLQLLGSTAARPLSYITGFSPQSAAVFLLSLVSGPPTGASLASRLYESGVISAREAERLIAVSSCVSPMYLAAGVGLSLMGDVSFGFTMWAVQTLTSLLFAIFTADRKSVHHTAPHKSSEPFDIAAAVSESISGGGLTMLTVCTTVIFFSCTGAMLSLVLPDAALFLRPLTELSSGLAASVPCGLPTVFTAFCCGFSGLAMIMQSASEASRCGLSSGPLFFCRLLCAVSCAAVSLIYQAAVS